MYFNYGFHPVLGILLLQVFPLASGQQFSMDRTYPAEIGKNATLWCMTSSPIFSRSCVMVGPGNKTLNLDLKTGKVRDSSFATSESYQAFSNKQFQMCAIKIHSVQVNDLGQWECKILSLGTPAQVGFINLLDNEMGFVKDVRLPRHVLPDSYIITLIPYLVEGNYTVDGLVEINAHIVDAPNSCENKCIILHSKETALDVKHVDIQMGGFKLVINGVAYDKDRSFLILYLEEALVPGKDLRIEIAFLGTVQDKMTGFYRSSYFDFALNKTQVVGSTQFQSIYARQAFPCFDEPDMKATFKLILGRQGEMITLSNMPREKTGLVEGTEVDEYETSVKMSTYLLSFIICEFKSLYQQTDRFVSLPLNVWAQEDKLPQLKHAANIGKKAIPFFEDMFDMKYPLVKMDLVAIPDFRYGAMENWGIIAYRDIFLFYDKTDSSELNRLEISMVVCHEIAHQWFGNLVTMRWWNDLWLNEGFATYMAYVAVNSISPETKLLEQIAFIETKDIFYLDAVQSSLPLSAEVKNPEYEAMQSKLTMYKGCLLIRMMENFLTPEVFRQGMQNYLKEHAYGNAVQDDLWDSLGEHAQDGSLPNDMTLKNVMDTWTLQQGYPFIHVNYAEGSWNIYQQKFTLNSETNKKDEFLWVIPISYKSISGNLSDTSVNFWLTGKSASFPARNKELCIFNAGRMGYYRVNYSPALWDEIIENFPKLPNVVRAQLVDDALFLSRIGELSYFSTFNLLKNLRTETDYIVLSAAENGLKFLMNMLVEDRRYPAFLKFTKSLVEKGYEEVRESTSVRHQDVVKRNLVMKWACSLDIKDCIDRAEKMFKIWKQTEENYELSVGPDEKEWVYCYGLKYGSEEDWDLVWKRTQETKIVREKSALYEALACTDTVNLLDKYLDSSIDPNSTIRDQDKRYVYSAIGKNNVNGAVHMLDWLDQNWEQILKYYEGNLPYNAKFMLEPYSEDACTQERFDKLNKFYKKNKANLGTAGQSVEEVLDKIKANLNWREKFFDAVFRHLERVLKETTEGNEETTNTNEKEKNVVEERPGDNEEGSISGNEGSETGNEGSGSNNNGSSTNNQGLSSDYKETNKVEYETEATSAKETTTAKEATTTGRIGSRRRNSWWRTMIHYLMQKGWTYQEAKAIIRDRRRLNNILWNDPGLRG